MSNVNAIERRQLGYGLRPAYFPYAGNTITLSAMKIILAGSHRLLKGIQSQTKRVIGESEIPKVSGKRGRQVIEMPG
ncbi:hypothetical protein [Desulfosediminicola ganghwensis]|uniref:hypothetical protein n=1 Tax=Desulfosediminicola ganghwensis TaxID=2569540 RepID=UPI0010AB72D3|nr:hypothetical protein [Desulfosediminicola ganghwensis]